MANQRDKTTRTYRNKKIQGSVVQSEALDFLRSIPSSSSNIVFLDPPFNLGKVYSKRSKRLDKKPEGEYRQWMESILTESTRVLKEGGTLYLYHLPLWAMRFGAFLEAFQEPRLDFKHWIAISMTNGFVRGRRLYPAHYALLMFTKGSPEHFKRPKIAPKLCRHCGEYVKDYGGYTHIIAEQGINLSDFWDDLSPVRHANRKHRAANELPSLLFERVFEISGVSSGCYVDPFAGSGAGVIAAARAGLSFKACDFLRANCQLIVKRLDMLRDAADLERTPK